MPEFVLKWAEQSGPLAMTLVVFCVLVWLFFKKAVVPAADWFKATMVEHQRACNDSTERMSAEAWGEIRQERAAREAAELRRHEAHREMIRAIDNNTGALNLLRLERKDGE